MANQPKTSKQLESELQAAQELAKKITQDLEKARKVEAEKAARLRATADKRARKTRIARKAEIDTLLIDYEDVVSPSVTQQTPPVSKSQQSAPKQENKPVEKQEKDQPKTGLWAWLNEKA